MSPRSKYWPRKLHVLVFQRSSLFFSSAFDTWCKTRDAETCRDRSIYLAAQRDDDDDSNANTCWMRDVSQASDETTPQTQCIPVDNEQRHISLARLTNNSRTFCSLTPLGLLDPIVPRSFVVGWRFVSLGMLRHVPLPCFPPSSSILLSLRTQLKNIMRSSKEASLFRTVTQREVRSRVVGESVSDMTGIPPRSRNLN